MSKLITNAVTEILHLLHTGPDGFMKVLGEKVDRLFASIMYRLIESIENKPSICSLRFSEIKLGRINANKTALRVVLKFQWTEGQITK